MAVIGPQVDLTYPYEHLGEGSQALTKALKPQGFWKTLKEAKRPVVIIGAGLLNRPDRDAVLQQVWPEVLGRRNSIDLDLW